jgi:hypothetical protein
VAETSEVRNAGVAFLGLFVASASLGALTPLSWIANFSLAAAVTSTLVLIDITGFKHLLKRRSRTRRMVIMGLSTLGVVGLLSFYVVILSDGPTAPDGYPYLVANSSDSATEVKAVPSEGAGTLDVFFSGEGVRVSCYVDESKHRWYKLKDREGWMPEANILASPHTGLGSPPRCPD